MLSSGKRHRRRRKHKKAQQSTLDRLTAESEVLYGESSDTYVSEADGYHYGQTAVGGYAEGLRERLKSREKQTRRNIMKERDATEVQLVKKRFSMKSLVRAFFNW